MYGVSLRRAVGVAMRPACPALRWGQLAAAPRGFASLQKVIFTATAESDVGTREGNVKSFGEHHGGLSLKLEKHPGHGAKGGGLDDATAQKVADMAHEFCPYSR